MSKQNCPQKRLKKVPPQRVSGKTVKFLCDGLTTKAGGEVIHDSERCSFHSGGRTARHGAVMLTLVDDASSQLKGAARVRLVTRPRRPSCARLPPRRGVLAARGAYRRRAAGCSPRPPAPPPINLSLCPPCVSFCCLSSSPGCPPHPHPAAPNTLRPPTKH